MRAATCSPAITCSCSLCLLRSVLAVAVVVVVVAVVVVVVEDYVAAGTYCSVHAGACMLLHAVLLLLAVAVFFSYGQFLL